MNIFRTFGRKAWGVVGFGLLLAVAVALAPAQQPKQTPKEARSLHGSWTDPLGDVTQGLIDLWFGSLFAEDLASDLEIGTNIAGFFPNSLVSVRVEMFFDTDNDSATGGIFGSFSGVDKVLEISLTGQFPFTAPDGAIVANLVDVASGASSPLMSGSVSTLRALDDSLDPSSPASDDIGSSIHQSVPLPDLALSAQQVPIGIRATDLNTAESDEVQFVFEVKSTISQ